MNETANIGASIQVKGELTGEEDLFIEGAVDGKISVADHGVTVGASGRVKAEIRATTVVVLGQVVGNITASDRIEITPSGSVEGDLRSPRVTLEDGACFRGAIDMKPVTTGSAAGNPTAGTSRKGA